MSSHATNILGGSLQSCSLKPLTGFYRDGCCHTGAGDHGIHVVCAVMTSEFLEYSKNQGNDLTTPIPEYHFPGLKAGDRWCLCVRRWMEALDEKCAPQVILESTHISALEFVSLEDLKRHEYKKGKSIS